MLKITSGCVPPSLAMLKAICPWVLAVGCVVVGSEARANVLWKGDFETGDLTQWDSTNLIKTGDRDNLVFVDSPCAEGKKCAKITLRDDIIFEPYNQSRVEVKHVGLHTLNGEDSYYAWSFMVPKDAEIRSNIGYWESTPTSKNTMTFFIEPAQGGGTNLKFGTGDLGQTVRWTAKLELNVWHRMSIHNHWSTGADGKVDVWYDGVQVVTGAMAAKRDDNKLFFQMGLHRSDPSPPVQDIYLDAAIEADSQADILAPLPSQGGSGGTGGAGGAAGANAGGSAGSSAGFATGGGSDILGGSAGLAGSAGAGAPGAAGMPPTTGGMSPQGGATTAPVVPTSNAGSNDSAGCSVRAPSSSAPSDAWPLVGLLALWRRRRASRSERRAVRD
jgi:hypothetical protein